jgi:hypothetical protein
MVRKANTSSKTLVATFVAATFGVSAGAALAQTTTSPNSHDEAAANSSYARNVTLTNQQNEQTLRYSRAHNLRICNLSGQSQSLTARTNAAEQRSPQDFRNPATRAGATVPANPVPLQVSFGGLNHQIQPGSCYDFRASRVHLSTGSRLPIGSALFVSILPASNGFVNGRTEAASSVEQLKEQVKQDDEQERQANTELSQARDKLAQSTRDLKQAQSQEQHVASAERQTENSARHAQQSEQNAQPQQNNDGTPR